MYTYMYYSSPSFLSFCHRSNAPSNFQNIFWINGCSNDLFGCDNDVGTVKSCFINPSTSTSTNSLLEVELVRWNGEPILLQWIVSAVEKMLS